MKQLQSSIFIGKGKLCSFFFFINISVVLCEHLTVYDVHLISYNVHFTVSDEHHHFW